MGASRKPLGNLGPLARVQHFMRLLERAANDTRSLPEFLIHLRFSVHVARFVESLTAHGLANLLPQTSRIKVKFRKLIPSRKQELTQRALLGRSRVKLADQSAPAKMPMVAHRGQHTRNNQQNRPEQNV